MKKDKKKIDWLKVLEIAIIVIGGWFVVFCFVMAYFTFLRDTSVAYVNSIFEYAEAVSNHLFASLGIH